MRLPFLFPAMMLCLGIGLEGVSAQIQPPDPPQTAKRAQAAAPNKHVYFDGEGIARPGPMDLVVPVRLLEAIGGRGGFKESANPENSRILRDGKLLYFERAGVRIEAFQYSEMVSGQHPDSNPFLRDGDHIIVN